METISLLDHVKKLIPFGFHMVNIVSVYDGDTVWAEFDIKGFKIKNKLRFLNINTPELRGKNEEEKAKAIEAKEFVKNLIEGERVMVYIHKLDPYYRHLAFIYPSRLLWSKIVQDYDKTFKICGGMEDCMELNE